MKTSESFIETTKAAKPMRILITQPRPGSEKSPYYELERRFGVKLEFQPFILLQPIAAKEFRRQKISITSFSAIIFTSRNAIDHFFRMCEEMRVNISQDIKYFCISESVGLYLQKFILYRKRKVFFGAEGTNKTLFDVINKHKNNESFLYPCSENQQDNDILKWLRDHKCKYATPYMYRSVSADVKELITKEHFDIICFFTPSGVRSLFDNVPEFNQNGMFIGAFGSNTMRAIEEAGLKSHIMAPLPESPSMITALEKYLVIKLEEAGKE
jgi:uroporphyrinogen-III synthase